MTGISLLDWLWYSIIGILLVSGAGAMAFRSNRHSTSSPPDDPSTPIR